MPFPRTRFGREICVRTARTVRSGHSAGFPRVGADGRCGANRGCVRGIGSRLLRVEPQFVVKRERSLRRGRNGRNGRFRPTIFWGTRTHAPGHGEGAGAGSRLPITDHLDTDFAQERRRGEDVHLGFDDDSSWSGPSTTLRILLQAGNDRTTARLRGGAGSRRPRGCARRGVRRAQHAALADRPPGHRVPALAPPSPHAHTVGGCGGGCQPPHAPPSRPPMPRVFPLPERLSHGIPRFPPICVCVDVHLRFRNSEREAE